MSKKKLIHTRKAKLHISPTGKISLSRPSYRIGGKTGINISGKGVSTSTRTRFGTINSKKGCSLHLLVPLAMVAGILYFALHWL